MLGSRHQSTLPHPPPPPQQLLRRPQPPQQRQLQPPLQPLLQYNVKLDPTSNILFRFIDSYKYSRKNTAKKGKYLKTADNPTFLGKVEDNNKKLVKEKCCKLCYETYQTISHINWHKDGKDCQCFDITGTPGDSTSKGWRWGSCTREVVGKRKKRQALVKRKVDRKKREVTTSSTTTSTTTITTTTTTPTTTVTTTVDRSVLHRDIECTKYDVTGLNLYWKYEYEIPSFCHSESTCTFCSYSNTFFSRDKLYQG